MSPVLHVGQPAAWSHGSTNADPLYYETSGAALPGGVTENPGHGFWTQSKAELAEHRP